LAVLLLPGKALAATTDSIAATTIEVAAVHRVNRDTRQSPRSREVGSSMPVSIRSRPETSLRASQDFC
jgi:hypothetical protein